MNDVPMIKHAHARFLCMDAMMFALAGTILSR